jgi:hypothetical protein
MTDRHDLLAYLATLGTLVFVFLAALIVSAIRPEIIGKIEAFGLGAITGGLIGILRLPRAQSGPTVGPNDNVEIKS